MSAPSAKAKAHPRYSDTVILLCFAAVRTASSQSFGTIISPPGLEPYKSPGVILPPDNLHALYLFISCKILGVINHGLENRVGFVLGYIAENEIGFSIRVSKFLVDKLLHRVP